MTTPRNRILALTASNIKSLHHVEITPDGTLHTIAGKNGQGKTAILESIEAALTGLDPELIRHGSDAAEITLNLSNCIIRRALTADEKETLMVTDANGYPIAKPKELLRTLTGSCTFRPLEFVLLGGGDSRGRTERLRKQRQMLIQAIPLTLDAPTLQRTVADLGPEYLEILATFGNDLANINLDQHALEVCQALHDLVYTARQELNAQEKQTKLLLDTTPAPTAAPPALPTPELESRLAQAREAYYAAKAQADTHAHANAARAARIETLERNIANLKIPYTREELDQHLNANLAALHTLDAEIERLNAEIERLQKLRDQAILDRSAGQANLGDIRQALQNLDQRDAQQAELDALRADQSTLSPSSTPSLDTLANTLAQAERDLSNRILQDTYDRAHAAHAHAKRRADLYTDLVTLFRDTLPKTLLAQANLPIPGLEIRPDHIAINGVPLHNLSTSEQIRVGVAIASTLAPACGFVLVDGAEALDPESLLALRDAAETLNLQLILTRVDPDATPAPDTTVIQNGQALAPPAVPAVPLGPPIS